MSTSYRILIAVFFQLLLGIGTLSAQESLPTEKNVQTALEDLDGRQLEDNDKQRVRAALEQTKTFMDERQQSLQALDNLHKQIQDAPAEITQNQSLLADLKRQSDANIAQQHANDSLNALQELLHQRNEQVARWQESLSEANAALAAAQSRPDRSQQDINAIQSRSKAIDDALKNGQLDGQPLIPEQRWQLQAERAALTARDQLMRQQLLNNSLLLDLSNSEHDLLAERIHRYEKENLELQNLINEKRRTASEQAIASLTTDTDQDGDTDDQLLNREKNRNQKFSDYLLQATDRYNKLTRLNLETKQALDSLHQVHQSLERQIEVLHGSVLLSRILNEQKQSLPRVSIEAGLPDQIADLRLHQFELNKLREQLSDPIRYRDSLLKGADPQQITPELQDRLASLISTRSNLVLSLSNQINALLNETITLRMNQQELQTSRRSLVTALNEQLFWIPSNQPIDGTWLKAAPRKLKQQIGQIAQLSIFQDLKTGFLHYGLVMMPLIILIAFLLWKRPALKRRLDALNSEVGHFKRDNQMHTPYAIVISLFLILPVALALTAPGLALVLDGHGQNGVLGQALLQTAIAWTILSTFHQILKPNGIAERHFHWEPAHVAFLDKKLCLFSSIVIILVGVVSIAQQHSDSLNDDIIGVIIILLAYAGMTWVLAQLLLTRAPKHRPSVFKSVVGALFTLIPVFLFIAVCIGYYYTALRLTDRLIETLYLLILWLLIEACFERALGVAARKLAYARALAKRNTVVKENSEGIEVTEEPTLGIKQVNQQSLRLIRLTLFIVFGILLYWTWSDVISVVSYLDNVTLYQYTSGSGEALAHQNLTLKDLLIAVITGLITIALAKNLPGLMEVLFLSNMRLAQGSSYAFTTLLTYIICGVGIVMMLSSLGISWDKLQWLVAALGVGLGFGLQEIFSNFISGLIILFERPVRIGDTVTIGGVSGTVTRIRIRATTIMDFDHKEIVVPNKTFILGQVINWTLSDTITRLTINVSVTAGTDIDQVKDLLYQIAADDKHVLKEPRTTVNLLNFTATALNYELNVYVGEMAQRRMTENALNRAIEESFSKNGLTLA